MRALAASLAALVLAVGLSGCTDGTPSARPQSSPDPSAAVTGSACQVGGFAPRTKVKVNHTRTVILYATRVGVPPGSSIGGSGLDLEARVHPGVHLTDPAAMKLPGEVARRVNAALSGYRTQPLRAGRATDWKVVNHGTDNRTYLVFNPGKVASGTWTGTACGAPVNDGSGVVTLRGRWTSARVMPRLYITGCHLTYRTPLERQAAREACR